MNSIVDDSNFHLHRLQTQRKILPTLPTPPTLPTLTKPSSLYYQTR